MNKLETARILASQTAAQGLNTEKEQQEVLKAINQKNRRSPGNDYGQSKSPEKNQQTLATGIKRRLTPLDNWEKSITEMENTIMKQTKHQKKIRKLMMTIFFLSQYPNSRLSVS